MDRERSQGILASGAGMGISALLIFALIFLLAVVYIG